MNLAQLLRLREAFHTSPLFYFRACARENYVTVVHDSGVKSILKGYFDTISDIFSCRLKKLLGTMNSNSRELEQVVLLHRISCHTNPHSRLSSSAYSLSSYDPNKIRAYSTPKSGTEPIPGMQPSTFEIGSAQRSFAPLQNSRWNHRSYARTEAHLASGIRLSSRRKSFPLYI